MYDPISTTDGEPWGREEGGTGGGGVNLNGTVAR